MKRLLLVIVLAAMAYAGWWFYAAHSLRSNVETRFADQRAAGWEASYFDIAVSGFPNRTDLTLANPVLRNPDGALAWQAPFFQILSLSYKTGHVIVAWPDSQTVITPEGRFDITSDGLRASVVTEDDAILRSNFEAAVLNIAGPDNAVAMAGVTAALQRIDPVSTEYRIALTIDGLASSEAPANGTLTRDSLGSLRADVTANLENPLTLQSFTTPPRPTALTLHTVEARYGTLLLKMAGDTRLDSQGLATGEVTIEAENWRESLNAAQANGDLPPDLTEALIEILSLVATFNGQRDRLDVTLGLEAGTVYLGPLPLGQLPALKWP